MKSIIRRRVLSVWRTTRPHCWRPVAIAHFMVHAPQSFFPSLNGGELAVLYSFAFLYRAAAGAGLWSIDARRSR